MIEDVLIEKLDDFNVCEFVDAAVKYNAKTLQEHCICFIVEAAKDSKPILDANDLRDDVKSQVCDRILVSTKLVDYTN